MTKDRTCGIVGTGNIIADAVRHGQDHYRELKRMNELQAKQIAGALSGEVWQSGGGIWLVLLRQGNGKLVVISDEAVCEYDNEKHFEESKHSKAILLHQNFASLN